MKSNTIKLDQLTSLRFFAAFMIVIHHCSGLFGINGIKLDLCHGVSFFFVLSGFILTYVYPSLNEWSDVKQFWLARIARVWPAYLAAFLFKMWLISPPWDIPTVAANLLMVQGWIPFTKYFFSYNAVSWSVSTELFFYLAFPFLISKWDRNWAAKLAGSGIILIGLIWVSNHLSLPDFLMPEKGLFVTKTGILYISPLSRIFEFIFGMCVALAWKNFRIQGSVFLATAYELGAVLLCFLSLHFMARISTWAGQGFTGHSGALWMANSGGSMLPFGLLIYVMAHGHGAVSRLLKMRLFVFLGEISFSTYLVHQILLTYYAENISRFPHLPNPVAFGLFLVVLLASSYVMWIYVEVPGRRLILGGSGIQWEMLADKLRRQIVISHKPLLCGISLACFIGYMDSPCSISRKNANKLTPASLKHCSTANFGSMFTLRGLDVKRKPEGIYLKLAWESNAGQFLDYMNAVHMIDSNHATIGVADYAQSKKARHVKAGDLWLDKVFIPADRIDKRVTGVAIAIYKPNVLPLLINHGPRDWDGRRLIIPLPPENGAEVQNCSGQ